MSSGAEVMMGLVAVELEFQAQKLLRNGTKWQSKLKCLVLAGDSHDYLIRLVLQRTGHYFQRFNFRGDSPVF